MDTMLNEAKSDGQGRQGRQRLSSLMDSDLAPEQLPQVVASWQQDADERATWHCYHLIGDVLRSEALAQPATRDAAMLLALRARLADEPVPLAPRALASVLPGPAAPLMGATRPVPQRSWAGRLAAPAAMAAGFVVVAGLLGVFKGGSAPLAEGGQMASNALAPGAALQRQVVKSDAGALVRSAGLDRYLEAHRKLGNSVAAAGAAEHRVQIVYESK